MYKCPSTEVYADKFFFLGGGEGGLQGGEIVVSGFSHMQTLVEAYKTELKLN